MSRHSVDDSFDDEDLLDAAFLAELDQAEASALAQPFPKKARTGRQANLPALATKVALSPISGRSRSIIRGGDANLKGGVSDVAPSRPQSGTCRTRTTQSTKPKLSLQSSSSSRMSRTPLLSANGLSATRPPQSLRTAAVPPTSLVPVASVRAPSREDIQKSETRTNVNHGSSTSQSLDLNVVSNSLVVLSSDSADDAWIFDVRSSFEAMLASRTCPVVDQISSANGTGRNVLDRLGGKTILPPSRLPPPKTAPAGTPHTAVNYGQAVASFDTPEVVSLKRRRRMAVVPSSSPGSVPESVGQGGDDSVVIVSAPTTTNKTNASLSSCELKGRKRLRRRGSMTGEAGPVVTTAEDDGDFSAGSEPVRVPRRKKRAPVGATASLDKYADDSRKGGVKTNRKAEAAISKEGKKKGKMTVYEAAHHAILDIEAINSSADDTEASSEGYDGEDTDDREFVASEGEEADESDMMKFRMESLLSQAPGFQHSPARPGAFRMRRIVKYRPVTPASEPGSADEWRCEKVSKLREKAR